MIGIKHTFELARREGWAVGAFNASNIETIHGIFLAAQALESPVIIEASPGEVNYIGMKTLRSLVDEYRSRYGVEAWLNLDHATEREDCETAIETGYELVHFDGSLLGREVNASTLKDLVRLAHRENILIEGEPDHITGSSNRHSASSKATQKESPYSDPTALKEFVGMTQIDTVAVFIGNVHGLYDDPKKLDLNRLAEIRKAVDCFLSLHGGSGIRESDIKKAIQIGITKINVNTELRAAFLEGLKAAVRRPKELAPYKYLLKATEAIQAVAEEKIKLFGSAGKAKRRWVKRSL